MSQTGWTHLKLKLGREEIGYDRKLMTDANQVWEVGQAIGVNEILSVMLMAAKAAGYSIEMYPASLDAHAFQSLAGPGRTARDQPPVTTPGESEPAVPE